MRPHCLAPSDCASKSDKHCKACVVHRLNNDPTIIARHRAKVAEKFADPERRARHIEHATKTLMAWHARPESAEQRRRHIEIVRPLSRTPEAIAKYRAGRKSAGEKQSRTKLAWCPDDRRADYHFLVREKRIKAADARAYIEADIARNSDEAKTRRAIARVMHDMRVKDAREKAQAY